MSVADRPKWPFVTYTRWKRHPKPSQKNMPEGGALHIVPYLYTAFSLTGAPRSGVNEVDLSFLGEACEAIPRLRCNRVLSEDGVLSLWARGSISFENHSSIRPLQRYID